MKLTKKQKIFYETLLKVGLDKTTAKYKTQKFNNLLSAKGNNLTKMELHNLVEKYKV